MILLVWYVKQLNSTSIPYGLEHVGEVIAPYINNSYKKMNMQAECKFYMHFHNDHAVEKPLGLIYIYTGRQIIKQE